MMIRRYWLIAILAVALATAFAACAGGQEEEEILTSGIQGQVLLGPTCPVFRENVPCSDRPFAASVEVWDADRDPKITTFATDPDGRFRLPLPPGTYLLEPVDPDPGVPPTAKPQTVVVPPDTFVEVTLYFDSGIR